MQLSYKKIYHDLHELNRGHLNPIHLNLEHLNPEERYKTKFMSSKILKLHSNNNTTKKTRCRIK